jgi:hypothetical protein
MPDNMRYLFAFIDGAMCSAFQRDLKRAGITCEVRTAGEFPAGDQGPEIWVRDEDYAAAQSLLLTAQSER